MPTFVTEPTIPSSSIPLEDINDLALRSELVTLGLDIPHSSSVIDPKVADFSTPLYHKLLAMEAYTYENSTQPNLITLTVASGKAGVSEYVPYWTEFNTGMMAYINHEPISSLRIKDLIVGIYCFMGVHSSRGAGDLADLDQANARDIFVMDGYIDTILGYPLNHFDDYTPEDLGTPPLLPADPLPEPVPESASKLTNESAVLGEKWPSDAAKVDGCISKFTEVVSDATLSALFTAPPPPPENPLSPADVWDKIMVDLNWQWYIDFFGSTVSIPERPDF